MAPRIATAIRLPEGDERTGAQTLDVLLNYGKPKSGSFLVEESTFPTSLVAETTKLESARAPASAHAFGSPGTAQLATLLTTSVATPEHSGVDDPAKELNQLLERQRRAPLPTLYGQKPGEMEMDHGRAVAGNGLWSNRLT